MNAKTELVHKHSEIWTLMGLSPSASEELNRIVLDLSVLLGEERRELEAAGKPEPEMQRSDRALSRGEYLERHEQRFRSLGVSESTRGELMGAAEFVCGALHNANVPEEQRQTAETIQKMMLAMGGPPPCCDDSLLTRSSRGAPCN